MVTERQSLRPAYLLHLQHYRETSVLLNLLTRDQGRIALVGRGVRRARSSARMVLQPFTPLLVSWISRGELGTLTGVERGATLPALNGSSLMSGLYLNELLMRLTHRFDPHPELFEAYGQVLVALAGAPAAGEADVEHSLRHFEIRMLRELGYGLLLERDARSGEPVQPQALYSYRVQHGPVLCSPEQVQDRAREGEGEAVPVSGRTLLAMASGARLGNQERREAKRLMRAEIDSHLGGRPLASRRLFRARRPGSGQRS